MNSLTDKAKFPFWHRTGSGFWHFYLSPERSVCGNWCLKDQRGEPLPIPQDATERMPSRAHGGGKVCKTCERNRP